MTQESIPVGSSEDDGTGILWRLAWQRADANFTDLYTQLATAQSALTAAESNIEKSTKTYWFDANDVTTVTAPISHTGGATTTYLTNDASGSNTTSYNPDSKTALWNSVTNKFDFSSLKIGDTVEFRGDLEFTNAAAQEVDMVISLAEGTAAAYELRMSHNYFKTAGTGTPLPFIFRIYIGGNNTKNGGARFRFSSAANATIKVNGWFYQITEV